MAMVEPNHADYWHGYRHGLRRARFGEQIDTAAEHEQWLALVDDTDASRAARGRGYRDGLALLGHSIERGASLWHYLLAPTSGEMAARAQWLRGMETLERVRTDLHPATGKQAKSAAPKAADISTSAAQHPRQINAHRSGRTVGVSTVRPSAESLVARPTRPATP
jgi:hypothetical protein